MSITTRLMVISGLFCIPEPACEFTFRTAPRVSHGYTTRATFTTIRPISSSTHAHTQTFRQCTFPSFTAAPNLCVCVRAITSTPTAAAAAAAVAARQTPPPFSHMIRDRGVHCPRSAPANDNDDELLPRLPLSNPVHGLTVLVDRRHAHAHASAQIQPAAAATVAMAAATARIKVSAHAQSVREMRLPLLAAAPKDHGQLCIIKLLYILHYAGGHASVNCTHDAGAAAVAAVASRSSPPNINTHNLTNKWCNCYAVPYRKLSAACS